MKSRLSVRCVDSLILKVAVLVTIINVGIYIVLVPSKNQSPKVHETKVIINNFYLSKPEPPFLRWYREKQETKNKHPVFSRKKASVNNSKTSLLYIDERLTNNVNGTKYSENNVNGSVIMKNSTQLEFLDVHFSVRSTSLFHDDRLPLMLQTWISLVSEKVTIITDAKDKNLEKQLLKFGEKKPRLLAFDCPLYSNNKWALLCKLYWEIKAYQLRKEKENWFCHFDDDTFVNVPRLFFILGKLDSKKRIYIGRSSSLTHPTTTRVYHPEKNAKIPNLSDLQKNQEETDVFEFVSFYYALGNAGYCISKPLMEDLAPFFVGNSLIHIASTISLPDDHVIGYVITHLLAVSLTHTDLLNSQFDDLSNLTVHDVLTQASFHVQFDEHSRRNQTYYNTEEAIKNTTENNPLSDRLFVLNLHQKLTETLDQTQENLFNHNWPTKN